MLQSVHVFQGDLLAVLVGEGDEIGAVFVAHCMRLLIVSWIEYATLRGKKQGRPDFFHYF